jgi:hypothetical protein
LKRSAVPNCWPFPIAQFEVAISTMIVDAETRAASEKE